MLTEGKRSPTQNPHTALLWSPGLLATETSHQVVEDKDFDKTVPAVAAVAAVGAEGQPVSLSG